MLTLKKGQEVAHEQEDGTEVMMTQKRKVWADNWTTMPETSVFGTLKAAGAGRARKCPPAMSSLRAADARDATSVGLYLSDRPIEY
jgi:hypothetical protein